MGDRKKKQTVEVPYSKSVGNLDIDAKAKINLDLVNRAMAKENSLFAGVYPEALKLQGALTYNRGGLGLGVRSNFDGEGMIQDSTLSANYRQDGLVSGLSRKFDDSKNTLESKYNIGYDANGNKVILSGKLDANDVLIQRQLVLGMRGLGGQHMLTASEVPADNSHKVSYQYKVNF